MKIVNEIDLIPGRKYKFLRVVKAEGERHTVKFTFKYINHDRSRIYFFDSLDKSDEDFVYIPSDQWVEVFKFGR